MGTSFIQKVDNYNDYGTEVTIICDEGLYLWSDILHSHDRVRTNTLFLSILPILDRFYGCALCPARYLISVSTFL